jgi:hypothetical protein
MKWLARQEQISALPEIFICGDVGSREVEQDRCALSQSTIRVQKTQGLKSVGGSQSGKRDHRLALSQLGLPLLTAITTYGQLAPSFSVDLKFERSGVWDVGLAGVGRQSHATERQRAPWTFVQAADV